MRTRANRSTRAGFGITVVAMAAVLGACGGSSHSATPPKKALLPSNIVLASVQTTAATKSAKVSVSVTAGGPDGFAVKLDGALDFATGDSQFTADLGGMPSSFMPDGLEMRVVDNVMYMKLPAGLSRVFASSGDEKWLSISTAAAGAGSSPFASLGESDPTKFFGCLKSASDDVTQVGTDSVRGVETKHYKITLDLGKASSTPADVWVDNDGRVRRMTMQLGGDARGGADATVAVEFFDFGAPVNVEAPPAHEIISMKDFDQFGGVPPRGAGPASVSG